MEESARANEVTSFGGKFLLLAVCPDDNEPTFTVLFKIRNGYNHKVSLLLDRVVESGDNLDVTTDHSQQTSRRAPTFTPIKGDNFNAQSQGLDDPACVP